MMILKLIFYDYEKKNLKQSGLPAFWNKIQITQEVKENAFWFDKTGQNVHIFEEVLFFQAMYNIKTEEKK